MSDRESPEDAKEDVLVLGERRARRPARWFAAAVLAALAFGAVSLVVHHRQHSNRAVPSPTGTARTLGPEPVGRTATVNDEYLVEVPAGDMRAALASAACRVGCTAHSLAGGDLTRAAGTFSGLRPLAGGVVTTGASRPVQQSIEGRATPDALVHLVIQRTTAPATSRVSTTDHSGDGYRSVRLSMVRDGWRFSAELVVRNAVPPVAAAEAWARSTAPPR